MRASSASERGARLRQNSGKKKPGARPGSVNLACAPRLLVVVVIIVPDIIGIHSPSDRIVLAWKVVNVHLRLRPLRREPCAGISRFRLLLGVIRFDVALSRLTGQDAGTLIRPPPVHGINGGAELGVGVDGVVVESFHYLFSRYFKFKKRVRSFWTYSGHTAIWGATPPFT